MLINSFISLTTEPGNYIVLTWSKIEAVFIKEEGENGCWVGIGGLGTPLFLPPFIQTRPHHAGPMLCLSSFWKCF